MRENDRLHALDWSRVYADIPGAVEDGVGVAFLRIRGYRNRRRRILRWAACAALVIGAAAILLRGGAGAPDRVVPLAPEPVRLNDDSQVFASRADACFHVRADCVKIEGEAVVLKLVTAVEFEKALCPVCGANARVE